MSRFPFAVFLSYSSRYRDWAEALQDKIEATLAYHGQPGKIFRDATDLAPGHSLVSQLLGDGPPSGEADLDGDT